MVSWIVKKERIGSERSVSENGALSGSPINWCSVERQFNPLPHRSHALVPMHATAIVALIVVETEKSAWTLNSGSHIRLD
jgi:hypothetical protein